MSTHTFPLLAGAASRILFASLAVLLFVGFRPAETAGIRTLAKGAFSGITEARQEVVKDEAAWKALWTRHQRAGTQQGKIPEVDFTKEMVVAVFMGEKNTGGYGVEIQKVEPGTDRLKIHVKRNAPAPDSMSIQAITTPFHIVAVPRSDLKPEFTE